MLYRTAFAAAALAAALAIALPGDAAADAEASATSVPAGWTLKGVVVLSRHGIRGPLQPVGCHGADGNCMNAISSEPWQTLGVASQNLTAAGYARVVSLGRYYRARFADGGLFEKAGCPEPGEAAFYTDETERTVATAGALMDGMFPGCAVPLAIEGGIYDATCEVSEQQSREATLQFVGGSWARVIEGELKRPIAVMSEVLGPFKPSGCKANGAAPGCTLATLPYSRTTHKPVAVGDQASEQLLFQYASGLPLGDVAWGKLPKASGLPVASALRLVNAIHAFNFRADNMPRYQAARSGSVLVRQILDDLDEMVKGTGPRLTVYASHDDNLLNVAGMLGFEWHLKSYQPYQAPPAGAIVFELWAQPSGALHVQSTYVAQTIEQMRGNVELTPAMPPATAVMAIPGCNGNGGTCAWNKFQSYAAAQIVPGCAKTPK